MNRVGGDTLTGQLFHHPIGPALGPSKDQCAAHVFAFEDLDQEFAFTALFDKEHLLIDKFGDRGRGGHLGLNRLVQHTSSQRGNLLRQGRRKEQRLPFLW